eukprot:scaffold958_cov128-Skeletonema_dohrnii-CCMP3373.AAC.10
MAAMKSHSISIPTKQGDGESMMIRHLFGASSQQQQDDAFSRYSNDFVRMKSLLLSSKEYNDDDDLEALATINRSLNQVGVSNLVHLNQDKRRRGNNSRSIKQGNERKTRLSWELHPTLLLHDLELELEELDNGSHHIFDDDNDEEASEEAATPGPRKTVARGERV